MEYDYKKLGLKCGLECHQQLDVGKLFCRCPTILRDDEPDIVFRRFIRPVASELGEYDEAALEAFRKGLSYVYQAYSDTTCLVETDSEPPHEINPKALGTVLEVALLVEAKILSELYVMRKGIFDGSNVSGFQRTMMVANGGKLKLKEKDVGVQTLILEEDAARTIEKREKEVVYRLDRLGVPLIELATDPDIFTPEEAKETALKIGELFRITGKAKRGLGTIRQDINISIRDGDRVEVKGIQELELIDEYVKREIQRQLALLDIRKELDSRKVQADDLKNDLVSLGDELGTTTAPLFRKNLEQGNLVFGVRLKGFKGLLGKEVQPGRRFGSELAGYVKAKTALKGIIHSDEMPGYKLKEEEIAAIEKGLKLEREDAFALVLGPELECVKALQAVLARCRQALVGVPQETRGAIGEGNTEYQRVLGGAARMYPETDLPTIKVSAQKLAELKKNLPLWADERKKVYMQKFGLSEKLAEKMKLSNHAGLFESLAKKGLDATTTAVVLLEGLIKLKRENVPVENISDAMLEEVLLAVKKGRLTKDIILDVVKAWAESPQVTLDALIEGLNLSKVGSEEIREIIKNLIKEKTALVKGQGLHAQGALMGLAMKEVRGKASGGAVSKILKEELTKYLGEGK